MAEIQRRAYEAGAPAILFENVTGTPFPAVCNLFGTMDRARFLFRDTLARVQKDRPDSKPTRRTRGGGPLTFASAPLDRAQLRFRRSVSSGARCCVTADHRLSELPAIKSWPDDGGAFITLPQVYTEHPDGGGRHEVEPRDVPGSARQAVSTTAEKRGRASLSDPPRHRRAPRRRLRSAGEPLRVSIFVGGPPCPYARGGDASPRRT